MAETYDAKIFQRDGVAMVLYPDGDEAVLADVMRYMNPGMEYDQATGEQMATPPPPAESATYSGSTVRDKPFGSIAGGMAEPYMSQAYDALTRTPVVDPNSYVPQSVQRINQAVGSVGGAGLSGLLGLIYGGAGLVGDVANATGVGGGQRLANDLAGMVDVAGVGPEARMVEMLSNAGAGRSIARTVAERANQRGPVPTMGSNLGNVFGEGWSDVYHWSRSPDDFTAFDPNKSTSAMSQLGPHVGTKEAADARYMGYADAKGNPSPLGFTMPLKADLSKPFVNPSTGQPWSEMDLEMFVSAVADENGVDRRVVAPLMRDRLAQEGYTSIPYVNDVEDPGNISSIMLTDRPSGSDAVLRSRFAKFDPAMRNLKNLSAGVAISPLAYGLLSDQYARENRQ